MTPEEKMVEDANRRITSQGFIALIAVGLEILDAKKGEAKNRSGYLEQAYKAFVDAGEYVRTKTGS